MTNWKAAVLAALAVGAVGSAVWLATSRVEEGASDAPSDHAQRDSLSCEWSEGQELGYRFELATTAEMNQAALLPGAPAGTQSQTQRREISGQFLWRVLSVEEPTRGGREATLLARFRSYEPVGGDDEDAQHLDVLEQTPVMLRVDERCRFLGVAAESSAAPMVVRQWQLLGSLLEWVAPERPGAERWTVTQHDPTGAYRAAYGVSDDGSIEKTRRSFLSVNSRGGGELVANILASRSIAQPAGGGEWLSSATVSEHIELRTQSGALFVRAESRAQLDRLEALPEDPLWTRRGGLEDVQWRTMGDYAQGGSAAASRKPDPELAALSPEEALARFRDHLHKSERIRDAVDMLVDYLRADPSHARALYQLLVDGEVRAEERSVFFLALEKAGGEACRDVLLQASQDPSLAQADHLRAFAALSDVPSPDASVVEALEQAARGTETHQARAATLAMGTLAGRLELNPELRERSVSRLRQGLHEHASERQRVLTMEAVGNAGRAGRDAFEERVRELTGSDKPRERATAHETLRRMGAPVDHDALLAQLESQANPDVREQIGRRLIASATSAPPSAVESASSMLTPTSPRDIRRVLIEYLGANADDDPRARAALIDHFSAERDPELLVLLGKYISADELGER